MLKKLVNVIILTVILLLNTGCSAVMASSGKVEPNLGLLTKGNSISHTSAIIGENPIKTEKRNNIEVYTYKLVRGNDPSPVRAVIWGALGLMTLGISELILTPLELVRGQTYYLIVEYEDEKLLNYKVVDKIN